MATERFQRVRVARLIEAEVLAINDGYRVKNSELGPVGIPFVRGGDIGDGWIETNVSDHIRPEYADRVTSKLTKPGDVAFITKGTVGRVGRIREGQPPVVLAPQVAFWRSLDQKQLNSRFLFYLLKGAEFQSNLDAVKTHGSMVADYVSMTDQKLFYLTLPSIEEQERAADVLGALDDKIELNRRMNETLEAMARRLFKSWFVDFDPVHAKAALRRDHPKLSNADLSRRALPKMAPEIAELFPDSLEDSTLGPIPKGWKVTRVDEVSEINSWTLGKNDELEIVDYIEISQVMNGDVGEIARYQRGKEPSRARRRLRHGDVVLSTVRPDRGAYFVVIDPPATLIASTGFAVFTSTAVPWSWTSCALTSPEVFEYLGHHADGGAYPAINPALIGKIEYALPACADVLNAFHSLASDWYRLAEDHRRESLQLRHTRDELLPCLLSGELSVESSM
jgi:type I restriction enzyme, S subunit